MTAGSGADSINWPKVFPLRFIQTRVTTSSLLQVMPPQQLLLVVKALTPSESGGDVTGGRILGNSGADSITINGTVNSALVHGGLTMTP